MALPVDYSGAPRVLNYYVIGVSVHVWAVALHVRPVGRKQRPEMPRGLRRQRASAQQLRACLLLTRVRRHFIHRRVSEQQLHVVGEPIRA